ncbi:MAG: iron dependent repressor, metal binding and dimerization domain protein [Oscillospiraceae bacterium]
MGVTEETAESDACRIEHKISDEAFECIVKTMGEKV